LSVSAERKTTLDWLGRAVQGRDADRIRLRRIQVICYCRPLMEGFPFFTPEKAQAPLLIENGCPNWNGKKFVPSVAHRSNV
jgi:hypothetical protein